MTSRLEPTFSRFDRDLIDLSDELHVALDILDCMVKLEATKPFHEDLNHVINKIGTANSTRVLMLNRLEKIKRTVNGRDEDEEV